MKTVYSIEEIRDFVQTVKAAGKTVAFVPTMGNLHEGHLTLVTKAKELADIVVVSIYVNQLQFGPNEDYHSYPRTMEQDETLLREHGVDMVFAPTSHIIYPEGLEQHTVVKVDALDGMHCGKSRPAFFTGISTVVTKLFNIVQPHIAVFGEKDFQQLAIIRKMVSDLCIPVEIVGAPIARSETGLALSSRNGYLSPDELEQPACSAENSSKPKKPFWLAMPITTLFSVMPQLTWPRRVSNLTTSISSDALICVLPVRKIKSWSFWPLPDWARPA